jgi:hypothetical protein
MPSGTSDPCITFSLNTRRSRWTAMTSLRAGMDEVKRPPTDGLLLQQGESTAEDLMPVAIGKIVRTSARRCPA